MLLLFKKYWTFWTSSNDHTGDFSFKFRQPPRKRARSGAVITITVAVTMIAAPQLKLGKHPNARNVRQMNVGKHRRYPLLLK